MSSKDVSFESAVAFASDLIRIPSPPGGEEEVARRVVAEMRRLGYDEAGVDRVGNAVGVIRGRGEAPSVMLSCHLDVVDPGEQSAWEHAPYGGIVAGGFLHGRGAMDIKGPLALQTYAAAAVRSAGVPAGDIIVAHTVLEERGGWGMSALMDDGQVQPGAVIIGESTNGDVCIGHRGRAELLVEVTGVAGHASAPERASNALDGAGQVLEAVRAFAGERLGEENPVLGRSSIVATDVVATPKSRNVIPDSMTVVLDWRVLPGLDAESAVTMLRSFLDERLRVPEGLSWDVRFSVEHQTTWTGEQKDRRMFSPGFLIAPDHPVALAAADSLEASTGRRPTIRPWTFATDGGHTCGEHGVPTIGYAPGEERFAHTNVERLELDGARVAYEAYPELIRRVQAAVAEG